MPGGNQRPPAKRGLVEPKSKSANKDTQPAKKKARVASSPDPKTNGSSEREEDEDKMKDIAEVLKLLASKPKHHLKPLIDALPGYQRALKGVFYHANLADTVDADGPLLAGDSAGVLPRPDDCELRQMISMRDPASALDMGLTIEGVVVDNVLRVIGPNTSRGLPMEDYRRVAQRSASPILGKRGEATNQHLTQEASRRADMSTVQRDLLARHEFNEEIHLLRDEVERPVREEVKRKLEKDGKEFDNP